MQFQQDRPKDKKLQLFKFFTRKLRKFCSTELYDAPLEGSTILSQCSCMTCAPLETSPLGKLNMQFHQDRTKDRRIRAFESAKNDCATTIVNRFGQVWTSKNKCEALFFLNRESHGVQIWPTPKPECSFLIVPRSKLYDPPKWWKQRFVALQLA